MSDLFVTVQKESRILTHFTVSLEDGTVVDDTRKLGKPVVMLLDSEDLSQPMKAHLIGMKAGETKQFSLAPEHAFGEHEPDKVQFFDIHQFPADIELEKGAIIAFEQPSGEQWPGLIVEIGADSVKVDFNHPLVGKTVTFDLEVVEIQ